MNNLHTDYLDYELLIKEYELNLLNQLRGFGNDREYLKLWVPGGDLRESIVNLIYAVKDAGLESFFISFQRDFLEKNGLSVEEIAVTFGDHNVSLDIDGVYYIDIMNIQSYECRLQLSQINLAVKVNPNEKTDSIEKNIRVDFESTYGVGLQSLLKQCKAEQAYSNDQAGNIVEISSFSDGPKLFLKINAASNCILSSWVEHDEVGVMKDLLAAFCASLFNCHIQEIRDHGVANFEYKLRGSVVPNHLNGIVMLSSTCEEFLVLQKLVKECFDSYRDKTGYVYKNSRRYKNPSSSWRQLSDAERQMRVVSVIEQFCCDNKINSSVIGLGLIVKNKRITISISDDNIDKPSLLMKLERHLKRSIDDCLEVYYQERKDENKLRNKNFSTTKESVNV